MLHWAWIILASMFGGFAGVVVMSMMFVAKDADRRVQARKGFDEKA